MKHSTLFFRRVFNTNPVIKRVHSPAYLSLNHAPQHDFANTPPSVAHTNPTIPIQPISFSTTPVDHTQSDTVEQKEYKKSLNKILINSPYNPFNSLHNASGKVFSIGFIGICVCFIIFAPTARFDSQNGVTFSFRPAKLSNSSLLKKLFPDSDAQAQQNGSPSQFDTYNTLNGDRVTSSLVNSPNIQEGATPSTGEDTVKKPFESTKKDYRIQLPNLSWLFTPTETKPVDSPIFNQIQEQNSIDTTLIPEVDKNSVIQAITQPQNTNTPQTQKGMIVIKYNLPLSVYSSQYEVGTKLAIVYNGTRVETVVQGTTITNATTLLVVDAAFARDTLGITNTETVENIEVTRL